MATQTTNIAGSGYGNVYVDSLIWGNAWVGSPVTFSFHSGWNDSDAFGHTYGSTWVSSEVRAVRSVFDSYSAVCNIKFSELVNNSPTANIALWSLSSSAMGADILGQFGIPDGTQDVVNGFFNYQANGLDKLQAGGRYYNTIVHEVGHGLGLAHPHSGGTEPDASRFPGVISSSSTGTYGLNQGVWTVMSYIDGYNQTPPESSGAYGNASTPMAFDIAALQRLYGSNYSYRTGNDLYVLDSSNRVGTDWSCIWDAGGVDTISNQDSWISCVINLNAAPLIGPNAGGYISQSNGVSGGYTIANGVEIENAIGGNWDDYILGNSLKNQFIGNNGNDTIIGGDGLDTALYSGTSTEYQINIESGSITDTNTNRDGSDLIAEIERIQFSDTSIGIDIGFFETAGAAYRLYKAAFDRAPDTGGLGYWINYLDHGADIAQNVAFNFIISDEFQSNYGPQLSNNEFITLIYNHVLDRDPDAGGLAYWNDQMNNHGMQRENLLVNFSESNENIENVAELIANGVRFDLYLA